MSPIGALLLHTAVKDLIQRIYVPRRDRAVDPEGEFDSGKRWYPGPREDVFGSFRRIRSPSAAWPFSYMVRARTRLHCGLLVKARICGLVSPHDVAGAFDRFGGPDAIAALDADVGTFLRSVDNRPWGSVYHHAFADWLEEHDEIAAAAALRTD